LRENQSWRHTMSRLAGAVVALGVASWVTLAAQGKPAAPASTAANKPQAMARTSWGHPNLQGVWSVATVTPLERPLDLAGKEALTEAEAAEYAKKVVDQRNVDKNRKV